MDDSSGPPIRVICGPTAAGKTFAATWFARIADVSIVSADSRQLYRGFDIGTAKPTVRERLAAPHYGIDVLEPTERASSAWWAERADGWIDEIVESGRTPIVVGGTGLYLRALFGSLFVEPELDAPKRAELQGALASVSTEELRRWVTALDPVRAHLGRTQLLRAVEIALLTGRRVSDLQRETARPPRRRARYLVIDPGPDLAFAIESRTRLMFTSGWPEEVRGLMRDVPEDAPAWNSTGYRTVRAMLRGELSTQDAAQRVIIETRQYAKRQRTWFRHQLVGEDVTRADVNQGYNEQQLTDWWREGDA
ncbi:MAG: tRNA (adenosine(37)-N6)-dimethylallyltransferase MiaA [Gemmatimonadota bacterium]|nr:tRNA (adenosine(37)-N6)-dimethylallyltransferase MiaA [Gemmatimonadota bacterium]